MDKKFFSIGEVSELKSITKKALRFYDKIGVLKPSKIDPGNGYRYYSLDQFVQIDIIKAFRGIDVSPVLIRDILKTKSTPELMSFLELQRKAAVQKIEEITRIRDEIDSVRELINASINDTSKTGVYRKQIEKRSIVVLPFDNWSNEEDLILEFCRFDRIIEKRRLANAHQAGILFEIVDNKTVPVSIFNTVMVYDYSDSSFVRHIPAGDFVCINYSKQNASVQLAKINKYIKSKKIEISCALQLELLNDVFSADTVNVELQLLIK